MTNDKDQGKAEPVTMFHYLLEMHRDGNVIAKVEINAPIESFPAVKMAQFASVETLLLDYGKRMWFAPGPPTTEAAKETTS